MNQRDMSCLAKVFIFVYLKKVANFCKQVLKPLGSYMLVFTV